MDFKVGDRVQEIGEQTKRRSGTVIASCGIMVRWDNGDKAVGLRRAISDCEKVGGKLVVLHKASEKEWYHCDICDGKVFGPFWLQHRLLHERDARWDNNTPNHSNNNQGEETMFDTIKDAIQNKLIYVVVLLKNGQPKERHTFGTQEEALSKYNELDRRYPPNKDGGVSPTMLLMARVSQS